MDYVSKTPDALDPNYGANTQNIPTGPGSMVAGSYPPQPMATVTAPPNDAEEKSTKGPIIIAVVMGVFAVIGIGLGAWGLVSAISIQNQYQDLVQTTDAQAAVIKALEDETGTTINSVADLPTFVATTDYLYIPGWGIKIKVPQTLTNLSYRLDASFRPKICFNATATGVSTFPAFADMNQNTAGMGCLTRVSKDEGNADADGKSFGTLVATIDSYNYFYTAPSSAYSTDSADLQLETAATQGIKNMLSTENISAYK